MAIFDRLDRLTSRQVDRTFAVGFELHPGKATPNGRPGPDPDREIWVGEGVLEQQPRMQPIEVGNRNRAGNDLRTLASGTSYEFSADLARFPQAIEVKQGDRILFDDTRRFEVVSVQPDGLARVVFGLVQS